MFERFDDPREFVPGPAFRAATLARGRRLRRRRLAARTGLLVAAALVVGVGAVGASVDRRLDSIDRAEVATIGEPASVDGPLNVLVAGLDGPIGSGGRPDAVAVVRVDPGAGLTVLSIPRDLWVPSAGRRLASVTEPSALVDAVEDLGIAVDHVVMIDPAGFVEAVDLVGGVSVSVPVPLRDEWSGLDLPAAACTTLDGEAALALVRARHATALVDGEWQTDPSGDLGRIQRQQAVAGAALAAVAGRGADVGDLWGLSGVLADHAVVDDGLTDERLVALARAAVAAGPATTLTLPVEGASIGQAAVLVTTPGPSLDLTLDVMAGAAEPVPYLGGPSPTQPDVPQAC